MAHALIVSLSFLSRSHTPHNTLLTLLPLSQSDYSSFTMPHRADHGDDEVNGICGVTRGQVEGKTQLEQTKGMSISCVCVCVFVRVPHCAEMSI